MLTDLKKIIWLLDSARNLQQNYCYISHRLLSMSLHYLAKYKRSKIAKIWYSQTECSKSWSMTRPFKETARKILRQWCRPYVVYRRGNIHSSQAPKFLEWSFVLAVRKRDCTRASATHTLYFQQVADGVRRCVKVGANSADIRRSCTEDQWSVMCFSLNSYTACRAGDLGRLIHLAARQCSSAHDTIKLLERETPAFIAPDLWPSIVQILTRWTTNCGAKCSSGSTRQKFMTWMKWSSVLSICGMAGDKTSSMTQLMSGTNVCVCVLVPKEDILSICFDSRARI